MKPAEDSSRLESTGRRPVGPGLAAQFTLPLGISAVLFSAIATFFLLRGADRLQAESADKARLDMALTTGAYHSEQPEIPPGQAGRSYGGANGVRVRVGEFDVLVNGETKPSRVYRIFSNSEAGEDEALNLFAPVADDSLAGTRFLVLVLVVTGGLVGMVILFAALTARRVAFPLREMIEDVGAISRGRLDRRIRTGKAVGEAAMLGRSVERMVRDLVEGQETERILEERQREVRTLREIRRNLKPMPFEPPVGWEVEALTIESRGAGSGDFTDAVQDGDARPTLLVGSSAKRGLSGALLMAMTRAYLRVAILEGCSPFDACFQTNLALNRDLARGLYASAMVARLEPADGSVELVSAGHEAPAVRWEAATGKYLKLQPNGIALGFDRGPVFQRSLERMNITLHSGDALFLFCPGVAKEKNSAGRELGEAGVYALAKVAVEEGLEAVRARIESFVGGKPKADLAFALFHNREA